MSSPVNALPAPEPEAASTGKSPFFERLECDRCDESYVVTKDTKKPLEPHVCGGRKDNVGTPAPTTTLRIYIVGAHSTGKTHLARWISKTYGLPLVTEVARSVLAERELPLEVLRADIERTADFQTEVFRRQAIAEDSAGSSFVSDRAFDNLAYAASHTLCLSKIIAGASKYIERLKAPRSVILFVRPHRELCGAQDGVREVSGWEEIIRIDGMIRLLLELHDLDHVVVASLSMAERARTIRAVLGAHGLKPLTS